jgi:SpoVK/Ycf46/Vps4 family AAA+-type ATPase
MQDRKQAVFVVATANDVSQLPPETLRRGRFDQVFFVDLPDGDERIQIWSVHINKSGRKPEAFDLGELSRKTDGYTGAELESIVADGLINAFHDGKDLDTAILMDAIKETVPISTTMKEKITSMKRWAEGRAISASGRTVAK